MTISERKQRLYDATHQGADIIRISHSGAASVIDTNKKFSIRDEKEPSACVLSPKGNRTTYAVKDYGMSGRESYMEPIDFYMFTCGMSPQNDFMLALEQLEHQFGCADILSRQDNRYEFRQYEATDEARKQGYGIDPVESFTNRGVELWGPGVTAETLQQLGWKQLKSFWWYNSEKDTVYQMTATDSYPIFAQQCEYYDNVQKRHDVFYKVYQPFEFDKSRRFRYLGKVPPKYIFCLDAVKRKVQDGHGVKLNKVLVVSGCSDSVNAWAMGYPAVYSMSETDGSMPAILKELEPLTNRVILVPDIDETGMREGKRMALDYPQLYTVWMTQEDMGGLTDNRGHLKKDLKDYRSLHPTPWDMHQLISRAIQGRFYKEDFDRKGNFCGYALVPANIYYYLWLRGYCVRRDDERILPEYIYIQKNVVSRVSADAVRNVLMEDCRRNGLPIEVQNKLSTTHALPTEKKSFLYRVEGLDFTKATLEAQWFYYKNGFVEVTATDIKFRQMTELSGHYVWADSIIPHNVRILGDLFTIEYRDEKPYVNVTGEGRKCNLLTLLWNTSRLHWRKTDEQGLALTAEEEAEEHLCLYAKLVNLGYLFYTRKILSEAYLTLFLDYKKGTTVSEANGGSGKSTVLKFVEHVASSKTIRTYNTRLFDSNFFFAGVHEAHDLLILDDCVKDLPWAYLNNAVTDALTVEDKHKNPVTIPFAKSPKIVAATNHVVKDESPSIQRRQWPITFSDFYHHKTRQNDYREERTVADTFGRTLFGDDYPEQDWLPDLNLMMQCVRLYLSLPSGERKVIPPMKGIEQRIDQAIMGDRFQETAESLLFPGSELMDQKVLQSDMMAAFERQGYHVTSAKSLTQKLKAFCSSQGYVFNPASVTNKAKDGETWQCKTPKDGHQVLMTCYYIQSVPTQTAEPEFDFSGEDAPPF